MRVGTDGVLLGAWCRIGEAKRILDVGTGTGLIALMAAQRSAACIDAVELDFGAACDAALNAGLSPWSDRVTIYKADFGDWFGRYTRPRPPEKRRYISALPSPSVLSDMYLRMVAIIHNLNGSYRSS